MHQAVESGCIQSIVVYQLDDELQQYCLKSFAQHGRLQEVATGSLHGLQLVLESQDCEAHSSNIAGFGVQAKDYKQEKGDWLSSVWSGFNSPSQTARIRNTGVPIDNLKEVHCSAPRLTLCYSNFARIKQCELWTYNHHASFLLVSV